MTINDLLKLLEAQPNRDSKITGCYRCPYEESFTLSFEDRSSSKVLFGKTMREVNAERYPSGKIGSRKKAVK